MPSPCLNICRLDAGRRWCTACWRSLDEIAGWASMDDAGKQAVWQLLPSRRLAGEPPTPDPAKKPT